MLVKMAKTIFTQSPITEITLRKYEKPYDLSKRDIVKKLCLSLGILQPGDSRDIVVDVLYSLLEEGKNKKALSSEEIKDWVIDFRKEQGLELKGIASSNIRRQIKRLRDIYLIEKVTNRYRICEDMKISEIFNEKIKQVYIPSLISRIEEYANEVDKAFEIKND